ncbi:MAG: RNA polymerase sigma factor [Actinomycetota bacterium]|nr:RNA polymerase sigma factor [Actinomycetota bacterium]MCL6093585.1 RNA polymerase sigma factor [Actinomycetota bacterium]MDA8166148.1 RNA polymerase sigma factor [Actinomycetota bacterium]
MIPETEKQLIARAKTDPAAFGRLFETYYPKIFGYALKRVGAVAPAQDITSEVFYKALSRLWQFRWRKIPFSAWLYRIATNEINLYFKKGARYRTVSLESLEKANFDHPASHELWEELEAAEIEIKRHHAFLAIQQEIVRLPQRYQEVIALRFFEGKKIKEIALILGKKEGTVKSLLSRALARLRGTLDDSPTQPSLRVGIIRIERSKNNPEERSVK